MVYICWKPFFFYGVHTVAYDHVVDSTAKDLTAYHPLTVKRCFAFSMSQSFTSASADQREVRTHKLGYKHSLGSSVLNPQS